MLLILLFFVVAMGFSIYCWVVKQGLLGLLSFVLWFMFVVYSFGVSLVQWDLYYNFGLFGSLMALIIMLTSLYMIINRPKIPGEEEPEKESSIDRYIRKRDKIRDATRKIRGD